MPIAMMRLLANRYVAVVVLVLVLIASVWGYGRMQFAKGRDAAQTEAALAVAALEQGMNYERDRADAEYRGAVLAREALEKDLAAMGVRVNRLLQQLRDARDPSSSGGPDDPGADGIGILIACISEYEQLGADAARLADKVGGLQGYIRAINNAASR